MRNARACLCDVNLDPPEPEAEEVFWELVMEAVSAVQETCDAEYEFYDPLAGGDGLDSDEVLRAEVIRALDREQYLHRVIGAWLTRDKDVTGWNESRREEFHKAVGYQFVRTRFWDDLKQRKRDVKLLIKGDWTELFRRGILTVDKYWE